jgi:hypothetical protein
MWAAMGNGTAPTNGAEMTTAFLTMPAKARLVSTRDGEFP